MIENDYLFAWATYGIAALGCVLVWCRLTRRMWWWLRDPLRLLLAILLLTPTIVDPGQGLFAPAIAITVLDQLVGDGNNAWRAVADLVLYGMLAMLLYVVLAVLGWALWRRRRGPAGDSAAAAEGEAEPTLRERMASGEFGGAEHRIEPRL